MSTQHKISATRSGTHPTMGDWDIDYEITFAYVPGAPAQGPSYSSGGQPADPAEVSFVSISPDAGDHGAFTDIAQKWLVQWAEEWLDEHYEECVEIGEAARYPDPDDARDQRIDDQLTGDDQ